MAKKESINSEIFYSLKNSEISGVPYLFLGNPGVGKSTSVSLYSKLRGYELVVLRGSTCSETDIEGFPAVNQSQDDVDIKHCKPIWFKKILENEKQGKKSLLFLDEITCCSPYVQSAMLNLIFDRKVNGEQIPDSCLIVAAGNQISNMTSDFQTLSALYNRFCLYNLVADENALDEFLSKYRGATTGCMKDILSVKEAELKNMESKSTEITEEMKNSISEYFETAIRETTRSLTKGGEKVLNLGCTETQAVYASQDGDDIMRGFITLRTLNYLRDCAVASFINFGKPGINSPNFKKTVEGLCGIALSRKNGEVVQTKVAENYYQSLVQTLSTIDKLSNTKIKVYEDFFNKVVAQNTKTELSVEEITSILGKFGEMRNDNDIKDVTKPLEDSVVTKLCELIISNVRKSIQVKVKPTEEISKILSVEKVTGMISKCNTLTDMYSELASIVLEGSRTYNQTIIDTIGKTKEKIVTDIMKLSSFKKMVETNSPEFKTVMPDIKKL